jgi:hypothetical protein
MKIYETALRSAGFIAPFDKKEKSMEESDSFKRDNHERWL